MSVDQKLPLPIQPGPPDGSVRAAGAGKCLDVTGGGTAGASQIQIYDRKRHRHPTVGGPLTTPSILPKSISLFQLLTGFFPVGNHR